MEVRSVGLVLVCLVLTVSTQSPPGPQLKCRGVNEVFYPCTSKCGDGCVNYRLEQSCALECPKGSCSCKRNDYFRHPVTRECVFKDDCPTLSEYDYYNQTKAGPVTNNPVNPPTTVATKPTAIKPTERPGANQNLPGPQLKCPGANEVFDSCPTECGDGCINHRISRACSQKCLPKGDCNCRRPDYFRHPVTGVCVYKDNCPKASEYDYNNRTVVSGPINIGSTTPSGIPPPASNCKGVNEEFSNCGPMCTDSCRSVVAPLYEPHCAAVCRSGCFCKANHNRHPQTGVCVPKTNCPSTNEWDYASNRPKPPPSGIPPTLPPAWKCHRVNEEYSDCGPGPKCSDSCRSVIAPEYEPVCTGVCKTGCFCKANHYRHPNTGDCIPLISCPPKDKWDYKNNRPQGIPTLPTKPPTKPPTQCQGVNEEYSTCSSECRNQCSYKRIPTFCSADCSPGCFCKPGHYRHPKTGDCVPDYSCPLTNEWDYANNIPITPTKPPTKPPAQQCHGVNEVFSDCGSDCKDECKAYCIPSTVCPAVCKTGCVCKPGHFRHPVSRQCIPAGSCPKPSEWDYANNRPHVTPKPPTKPPPQQCKGSNEEYSTCGSSCRSQCSYIRIPTFCTADCKVGCFCKPGHLRHPKTGVCVPENSCPLTREWDYKNNIPITPTKPPTKPPVQQCNGVNEVFSDCGSGCTDDCKNYRIPPAVCPAICRIGCHCKPGHFRHPVSKQCILADTCPKTSEWDYTHNEPVVTPIPPVRQCTGQHEVFNNCGSSCRSQCSYIRLPTFCTADCKVGCFCKPGYLRHPKTGVCVPENSCPLTSEWDYKNNIPVTPTKPPVQQCNDDCKNYRIPPADCPATCMIGCRCKPGQFRHPVSKRCIPADDCPKTSEWDYMHNEPVIPPPIPPVHHCKGQHEIFNKCGSNCTNSCRFARNKNLICIVRCDVGCFCKPGYYRHPQNNACVPENSCPTNCDWDYINNRPHVTPKPTTKPPVPHKCIGVNEVYNPCGSACGDGCSIYRSEPKFCTEQCVAKCFCKPGYFRHPATLQCVLADSCPSNCDWNYETNQPIPKVCGGQNEEYREKGSGCGDGCTLYRLPPTKCVKEPKNGCFCKFDYYRDPRTGICVPKNSCPTTSVWDYLNNKPIKAKTCTKPYERYRWLNRCWEKCNRGPATSCNQQLTEDCYCLEGYCRNEHNECKLPQSFKAFHAIDTVLASAFQEKQRILNSFLGKRH